QLFLLLPTTKIRTKKNFRIIKQLVLKTLGVGDSGYNLCLWAIAKLLKNKYLRLFSFYFHTLTQQRRLRKETNLNPISTIQVFLILISPNHSYFFSQL
uniref:hypothetical protein n=1 Tax=Okeania sp. SIO2F4 TaxID=2607790 RepID=UPI0025D260E5